MEIRSHIPNYNRNHDENIKMFLDEVSSIPRLSENETEELTNFYYVTRDESAKKKLIESNLRLVVSIASSFYGNGLEFLDLVQEGNLGLINGIERFNPEKGYKLSTYVTKTIYSKILDYIYVTSNPFHVSIPTQKAIFEYQKNKENLYKIYGPNISLENIAEYSGIPYDEVVSYEKLLTEPLSIYQRATTFSDSARDSMAEIIPNENAEDPQDTVINKNFYEYITEDITKALDSLSEKKCLYIMLRYGLYDGIKRTLKETAIDLYELGINSRIYSEESINKTINDSFKQLSKSKHLKHYKDYL